MYVDQRDINVYFDEAVAYLLILKTVYKWNHLPGELAGSSLLIVFKWMKTTISLGSFNLDSCT